MARPDPKYGQIVRFRYLWRSEEHEGFSEGAKHRPCAVVVAIRPKEDEPLRVMVCPITHSEPKPPSVGIEISAEDSKESGLDDQRSWVIVSEVNKVSWASGRFERTNYGRWEYGELPATVMTDVRDAIVAGIKASQMDIVDRDQIDERAAPQPRA